MTNGMIVLLYNSEADIRANWNSLLQLAFPTSVHVIDNASTDNGPKLLQDAGVPVHVLPTNIGFTAAINRGIKHFWDKDIDFLWLVNPDVQPCSPNWDDAILTPLTSIEKCGLVGTKQVDVQGSIVHTGGIITKPHLCHLTVFHDLGDGISVAQKEAVCPTRFRHRTEDVTEIEKVSWVTFAAVALRMEMVREVGLLDERYFLYASDSDYAMQAAKKKWWCYYNPSVVFRHTGGASMRSADSFIYQQARRDIKQFALEESIRLP